MRFLTVFFAFIGAAVAQNSPKWVPFPADHWPQEPDGLNGMKFDASRAETEKVAKLESCETIRFGNLHCKTTLTVAGKVFRGDVVFVVGHDPKTDVPIGEGHLTNIGASIDNKAEFAFVKSTFIKMYGQPHHERLDAMGREYLTWDGNKADIRLSAVGFALASNMWARGGRLVSTLGVVPKKN